MAVDTKWIVGTGVAIIASVVGSAVAVIAVAVTLVGDVRADLRRMDDRLRAVEIAFGKVDQRLETLERLHLPTPQANEQ